MEVRASRATIQDKTSKILDPSGGKPPNGELMSECLKQQHKLNVKEEKQETP